MRLTVAAALAEVTGRLSAAGVPTPAVDAELLLRHVTGWSRSGLLLRGGETLGEEEMAALTSLAERRAAREPLQLILGAVGFRHLEVQVRPGVFIPRPETEVLAGEAIARTPAGGVAVEPCTGTGAVACAVAQEASPGRVLATDVSPDAVALARLNAARLGLAVEVMDGDLLTPAPPELRGVVDVVVCNPPYLTTEEFGALEPEVAEWDPVGALVAGKTGHEVVERLVAQAGEWLRPGGWLLLEVDHTRAEATAARLRVAGLVDVTVIPDLTGRPRVTVARTAL